MTWNEFYHNRVNNTKYENYFNSRYSVFLNFLKSNIKEKYTVLEVGCGTGLVTKCIYSDKANFNLTDNNIKMLKLSEINLSTKKINIKRKDIKLPLLSKVDLIYSHGVLEHFKIAEIKQIIHNQLRICNNLVHYVPTNRYSKKSYGNELLLSTQQWNQLVKPTKILEFNNGQDIILSWKKDV